MNYKNMSKKFKKEYLQIQKEMMGKEGLKPKGHYDQVYVYDYEMEFVIKTLNSDNRIQFQNDLYATGCLTDGGFVNNSNLLRKKKRPCQKQSF